jgi:hypothetical protein
VRCLALGGALRLNLGREMAPWRAGHKIGREGG